MSNERVLSHALLKTRPSRYQRTYSLEGNLLGDKGARAFEEMFAFNDALTDLDG